MINILNESFINYKHNICFNDDSLGVNFLFMSDQKNKKLIFDRICAVLKEKGLENSEFQKKLGILSQHWNNWRSRGVPSKDHMRIADLLEVNFNWLVKGEGDKYPKSLSITTHEPTYVLGGFDLWDDDTPLRDDEVALPFFREVELSAGSGRHEVIENHGRKLRFAKSTLKKGNINAAAAACVTVSGTSMDPVLPDGSVVGIDTSNKTIIDGKPYAVNYHGDLLVKRVYKLPGGGFRLNSYNTTEYPDIYCSGDTLIDVLILGKVFWSSQLW